MIPKRDNVFAIRGINRKGVRKYERICNSCDYSECTFVDTCIYKVIFIMNDSYGERLCHLKSDTIETTRSGSFPVCKTGGIQYMDDNSQLIAFILNLIAIGISVAALIITILKHTVI